MSDTFISQEKVKLLEERMKSLGIDEADIEERFIRAQGRGGQKINKTSACVHLKHIPTGIEVKCQESRSQASNRFFARRVLTDRIEAHQLGEESALARKIRKIKRQKTKRAKRARAKVQTDTRRAP
ncbi:MAG TPA: peptide chain release factor-like protein [Deltaproteobacteria bacterium]|jgi:protein subunit release factor B|nr:peptide chain release factor-like protein [Deltaproteobacteria bacterium]HQJ07482.1 peptide chain release factor-like protein [Deltaproteobacteria bacterium]